MRRAIAHGAAWMMLLRLLDRGLGLISVIALARLLSPGDFGVMAMAMTFIALIELAGAFSFDVALIQRPDPTREHYDTAWTMNLGFAVLCAALIAGLSPLAAAFYKEPELVPVMVALSLGWAIQGLENIGIVNFRRNMDFSREFRFMLGRRLVGFVVTLTMAFALRSYWALIIGTLATRLTSVALSYRMDPYRPRLALSARRDLLGFSGWMLASNLLGFGLARLPHFAVGRLLGPATLGLYTMSSEVARLPSTELSAPINRAVLPGLSRLNQDLARWRELFVEVMGTTVVFTLPTSLGLALLAPVFVDVVLGPKWSAAVPTLVILSVAGAVEVVAANNGVAYLSLGLSRMIALISAIKLAALSAFAWWWAPTSGAVGIALAELCAAALTIAISLPIMFRTAGLRAIALLHGLWRPVLASAAMCAALWSLAGSPLAPSKAVPHTAGWLVLCVLCGALTYVACLFGLWRASGCPDAAERRILTFASQIWVRFRPRGGG